MSAPVSVIIPTLNAAQTLPRCLEALMPGLEAGLIRELIVCDGGSDDGTDAIAQAWGGEVFVVSPSRGGQLRKGCAAARGDWLLVLHADTALGAGWAEVVSRHIRTSRKAAWFRLKFDSAGLPAALVAAWANLRSGLGLPYGDQGLVVPRQLYVETGGYPDIPLMEDVAIARMLKGQLVGLPTAAVTSAAKFQQQGWLRRGARNLWTLARYVAGTDPARLARRYQK